MPVTRHTHSGEERKSRRALKIASGLGAAIRKRLTWKRVLGTAAILGVILFSLLTMYVAWVSRDLPDPNNLANREVAQSTKIYDRTGKHLLYEIFSEKKRTVVELQDIPSNAINAAIAVEDSKFYEHKGVRLTAIARAILSNVFHLSSGRGGASTLTQQLVKNAIVGNERSFNRKVKEAILAMQLERKYTKQEILKLYFNEIPYGSTNYGIEAAAQSYFGKSSKDLSLAESATLAGIVQLPTYYLNNPDKLKMRRNFVLSRMKDEGFITEEQASAAKNEPLELRDRLEGIEAPHFVLHVKQLLSKQFGEKLVETGGLKVITTLDYEKYKIAQEEIEKYLKENGQKYNAGNAALVAVDPKTGQVLVMIGSKNYFGDPEPAGCTPGRNCVFEPEVNVALRPRQPGSSFKPFVYTAGFERGYTAETILYDTITDFDARPNASYIPKNFDGKERGPVTVRTALQGSLNIPAVKMLYLVGIDYIVPFAQRFGYTTLDDKSRLGLSLVLGGAEVLLVEHATAYAALANNGVHHPTAFILSVTDTKGKALYEWKEEKNKAIEPDTAALITDVLSDDNARAYIFGRGSKLTLPGRPAAAKTGTTDDYRDGWTMGYVPQLAAGVWTGNNDNTPMKRAGGSIAAAPIWHGFMSRALKNTPVVQFPKPPENTAQKPILRGGSSGKITVKVDTISGKLATSSTPEEFVEERTYMQPHDILHYVDLKDPRGPEPKNPSADPQYILWETGVKDWINKQGGTGFVFDFPPTEYDDVHQESMRPSVAFTSPTNNTVFTTRTIVADVHAGAPRGIATVKYYIDGQLVGSANSFPFTLSYEAHALKNGNHELKARAYDDVGNIGETSIAFTLDTAQEISLSPTPTFTWISPSNGSQFLVSQFPVNFQLSLSNPSAVSGFTVVAQSNTGDTQTIYSTQEQKESHSFVWNAAPPGNYTLSIATNSAGVIIKQPLLVEVKK